MRGNQRDGQEPDNGGIMGSVLHVLNGARLTLKSEAGEEMIGFIRHTKSVQKSSAIVNTRMVLATSM